MTEYKKLVALVEKLEEGVRTLYQQCSPSSSANEEGATLLSTDTLFAIAVGVRAAVIDAAPRMQKIVTKAREKDPNRQIYNEMMCDRIEELFNRFAEAVYELLHGAGGGTQIADDGTHLWIAEEVQEKEYSQQTVATMVLESIELPLEGSAVLAEIEGRHNSDLLRRAAAEAWAGRVAGDVAQHVLYEEQIRQVLVAEEKVARALLVEANWKSKRAAQGVLALREAAAWDVEQRRRIKERLWLSEAARAVTLGGVVATTFISRGFPGGSGVVLHRNLKALCAALLTTPEDISIRRLRCNNQQLIADYGHCCVATCPGNGICQAVQETGEMMWSALGYTPQYTTKPSWPIPTLLRTSSLQDVRLPCGESMSSHTFTTVGFEDYSERFFELKEPDPTSQPDEWMRWFDMVGKAAQLLGSDK